MKVSQLKKKRKQNAWSKYCTDMYYALRAEQEARCEAYSNGYATEEAEFYREVEDKITFKSVLIMLRGTATHNAAAAA